MANIELPIKRKAVGVHERVRVPFISRHSLPLPIGISGSFRLALELRQSACDFPPLSETSLATWLHFTSGIRAISGSVPIHQRRYVASFGALHPTHIIFGRYEAGWFVYDPESHEARNLQVNPDAEKHLWTEAQRCFAAESGTLIVLVADQDLAEQYYENPETLLFRDSGVLLGHASLVAAALGLSFRILGATGSPWVDRLTDWPFNATAVGLAWLGGSGHVAGV